MSTVTFDILARDHASSTFRRVSGETQQLTRHMDGLRSMMRRVVVAFGAFEVGRELTNFAKESVKAFAESQAAQTRLTDAYKRFPALAQVQINSLRQLNQAIQDKTGTDDDQVAAAEAVLAQFNLTGDAIKRLIPVVNDYAQKTGQDITTAATGVGRALLGNTRALKTIGIQFKATGNQANDAAALTQLLSDKLGGFAERQGKTAQGQARILSESFRDVREELGQALLPSLLKVGQFLNRTVIPAMGNAVGFIQRRVAPAFRAFAGVIAHDVVPMLARFVGPVIDGLVSAFHSIAGAVRSNREGLSTFGDALKVVAGILFTKVLPVLGGALKIALEVLGKSLGAVIHLLGLLGSALRRVADFFSGTFVHAIGTAVSQIIRGFKFIADVWLAVVGGIIHGAAAAFGWVPGVGGKLKSAAQQFDVFRSNVDASLTGLANDAGKLGTAAGVNFGQGFFGAIQSGFATGMQSIVDALKKKGHASPVVPTFSYNPTALAPPTTNSSAVAAGKAAGNGLASGLKSTVSKVVDAAKAMVDKIDQQFKKLKDSAKQLAQSIAQTMRGSADLSNISATDSLGSAMAPTIAGIKDFLESQLKNDRQFRRLLKQERARGLSQALYRQLAQAGPEAAGGIVRALAGASKADLREISGLNRQIGGVAARFGRNVSQDVYGDRLKMMAHEDREANRLLRELIKAVRISPKDAHRLAKEFGQELRHLEVRTDQGKLARHRAHRIRAKA